MIATTILFVTLLSPSGASAEQLPLEFKNRAECRREKALIHAATLPAVTNWRLLRADCVPAKGSK